MSKFNKTVVRTLIKAILQTRADEIDCEECFGMMDEAAEHNVAGRPAPERLPLIEDHLHKCDDCREEYEQFLIALKSADG